MSASEIKPTLPAASTDSRAPGGNTAGKVVVIGVFVVALAAASFALWWNMNRGRRSLAFWGPQSVRLIQQSRKVELLVLEPQSDAGPPGEPGEFLQFGERTWQIVQRRDLSGARGLVHARHALTDDASFEPGSESITTNQANWTHAVRFGDDQGRATLLMDFPARRFANFETGQEITVIPKIADGWKSFVDRQK